MHTSQRCMRLNIRIRPMLVHSIINNLEKTLCTIPSNSVLLS
jgi:hypothetical protein